MNVLIQLKNSPRRDGESNPENKKLTKPSKKPETGL
jgi:hypothetical protein